MKARSLALFLLFSAALVITNSYHANSKIPFAQAGSSGDPITNLTCAQSGCHPSPAQTPVFGHASTDDHYIVIGTGVPSTDLTSGFTYTPNTNYNISFVINSFTGRYGFQMVALTNANHRAGRFTVTNSNTEFISYIVPGAGDSIEYIGHKGASSTKNWTYKWASPASGDVTFYYAFNTANANDDPNGDVIYKNSITIHASTVGINEIPGVLTGLNVFPNPVNSQMGVSFNMVETANVTAGLYNLQGELMQQVINEKVAPGFYNQNFSANTLAAGIYVLKLKAGDAEISKKIVKQ